MKKQHGCYRNMFGNVHMNFDNSEKRKMKKWNKIFPRCINM